MMRMTKQRTRQRTRTRIESSEKRPATGGVTPISPSEWEWFGHPGHFICAQWCQFHLCTKVGDWLISTVGEYLPPEGTCEIIARSRGIELVGTGDARRADYMKKIGYEKLGAGDGIYETYVFHAGHPCRSKHCDCGLPFPSDYSEVMGEMSVKPGEARALHMKYCEMAARGEIKTWEEREQEDTSA
jgi:hypothetical protein